jgi:hypothetical protein
MEHVVMDYLIKQGLGHAAVAWAGESGAGLGVGGRVATPAWLLARQDITLHVLRGEVENATRLLTRFSPGLLDAHPTLQFTLKQQQLIELVRNDALDDALVFAQELMPLAQQQPDMLQELERTMALFALGVDEGGEDKERGRLMGVARRWQVVQAVNAAVFDKEGVESTTTLEDMVRRVAWEQDTVATRTTCAVPSPHLL